MKQKSFLQRPEGKVGVGFGVLLVGLFGWFLYWILPTLLVLMQNILYAGILAGCIFGVVYLLLDPTFRTVVSYGYKTAMRAFTGFWINIDPIGILKSYVEDLKSKLSTMDVSIANLNGQTQKLRRKIEENEGEYNMALRQAHMAQKNGDENNSSYLLYSRKAGRLEKSNQTLKTLLKTMQDLHSRLRKMREVAVFLIQDMEGEIEVKQQERAMIKASHSAFSAARKIVQGEPDQRAVFDATLEHLADDYALKLGDIEEFIFTSEGFLQGVDLENAVYSEEAQKKLAQWDQKIDTLVGGQSRIAPIAPKEDLAEDLEENSDVARLLRR